MKMKLMTTLKIIRNIAIILLIITVLQGCGSDSKYDNIVIDIDALAEKIIDNAKFDEPIVKIDENGVAVLYNFGAVINITVYAGSGATAEEIIIIETSDINEAKAKYAELKSYLNDKKITFEKYNAAEMYKLEKPVLRTVGKYVIYCISPNADAVDAVINDYINQ